MIEKFFDNIAKALYDSLGNFDGLNKLVLTIGLLMFVMGIIVAIYMYKEVKKANEKTLSVMEHHANEYKEMNKAGMRVIEKVNDTMSKHSNLLDKNNDLLDILVRKYI